MADHIVVRKTHRQLQLQACGSCNTTTKALSLCARCRRLCYCSQHCQKADFASHKKLCIALSKTLAQHFPSTPVRSRAVVQSPKASAEQFFSALSEFNGLMVEAMGRPAGEIERQFLYSAPRCASCRWTTLELNVLHLSFPCPTCAIGCCSQECFDEYMPRHSADACRRFVSIARSDDLFFRAVVQDGRPEVPAVLNEKRAYKALLPLPADWPAYFAERSPIGKSILESDLLAFTTAALSKPLVVLSALAALLPTDLSARLKVLARPRLIVHIVGASEYECTKGLDAWEELLHLLPKLRALKLIFVGEKVNITNGWGREMDFDTCPNCSALSVTRSATYYKKSYAAFVAEQPSSAPRPDVIVAYNQGWHESPEEWLPSMIAMLRSGAPVAFTAYSPLEMKLDRIVLESAAACTGMGPLQYAVPPGPYAFCSLDYKPDVINDEKEINVDGTIVANAWLAVVDPRGK